MHDGRPPRAMAAASACIPCSEMALNMRLNVDDEARSAVSFEDGCGFGVGAVAGGGGAPLWLPSVAGGGSTALGSGFAVGAVWRAGVGAAAVGTTAGKGARATEPGSGATGSTLDSKQPIGPAQLTAPQRVSRDRGQL